MAEHQQPGRRRGLAWLVATALWRAGICDQPRAIAFGAALSRELDKERLRRRAFRRARKEVGSGRV